MLKPGIRTTWITVLCIVLATFGVACLALIRQSALSEQNEKADRQLARVWRSEAMMAELLAGTRTECQFDNLDPLVRIANSVPHIEKVQSVRLFKVDLSDRTWGLLRDLYCLKDLAIDSCQGADTLLAEIAGIRQLEHLVITETFISEKGMKSIARFPRLKKLELGRKCRGVSPEPLRENASLEGLNLPTIDDRWIDVLKTLPNLKTLDIDDADSQLTPEMISRLSRALPQVEWHRVGPIRLSAVREPLVTEPPFLLVLAVLLWVLHAAAALSLSAPILILGRKRFRWYPWELLAAVLPFLVWVILVASPLSVGRKGVANLVELYFLAMAVPVAAAARVAIGSRFSQRICAIALIAILCLVAAAIFFAVPPFPTETESEGGSRKVAATAKAIESPVVNEEDSRALHFAMIACVVSTSILSPAARSRP